MKLIKHAAIKLKLFCLFVCLEEEVVFVVVFLLWLCFCLEIFFCSFSVLQQICKYICKLLLRFKTMLRAAALA